MALEFVFWDVQHGNATYVSTPRGQDLVIDLGTGSLHPNQAEFSPLDHMRDHWGIEVLDQVVITHPHRDHLDDIVQLDAFSPRVLARPRHLTREDILRGNQPGDREVLDTYFDYDRRYSRPVDPSVDPSLPSNNGGVEVQTFTPTECAASNLNNHSLVTVFRYAGITTVIPGDNEAPSWKELLEDDRFRAAIDDTDVLLAPHHGREAGFSRELFEVISPRLTVISDGPATETNVSDRYSKHSRGWTVHKRSGGTEQRKVLTTRQDGVIVIRIGTRKDEKTYLTVEIE